jgi:hypothetical protein
MNEERAPMFYPTWDEFCVGFANLISSKDGPDAIASDLVDFDEPSHPFRVEIHRQEAPASGGRTQVGLTVTIAPEAPETFVRKIHEWLSICLREYVKTDPNHILVLPRFERLSGGS